MEWPALWTESKDDFLDKEGFVSSVISVIVAWCDRLSVRLTNDNEGEWTDDFLERLSQSSSETQLHVQVGMQFPKWHLALALTRMGAA